MAASKTLHQTVSEEQTLKKRGYKLISKIGEGSYAEVYIGQFQSTTDAVPCKLACKIIDTKKCTRKFVSKFLPRELDILVKLSHPHIVHTHSIFQRKTKYFIFMRYAESGDLLDFILKYGVIVEPQARFWVRQIGLAVQYLHKMHIAHRDIKCENILVTANHNVKLCDFGFARYTVDDKMKNVLSETFCGSLSYASPEILKGTSYEPKLADMWALGVLIFTMLNKAMPFDDTHVPKLYKSQIERKWKFRRNVVDKLSIEVKTLVRKMLEPDVAKRINIDDVINSPWIAMDSRLKSLSLYEETALLQAKREAQTAIKKIQDKPDKDEGSDGGTVAGAARIESDSFSVVKKMSEHEDPKRAPMDSRISLKRTDKKSRSIVNASIKI